MRSLYFLLFLIASTAVGAERKLPLIEVPSAHDTGDTMVVFISGDGGWASIDKSMARLFAEEGIPVAGLNALQYFWTKKTPAIASRDLATIMQTYLQRWKKSRVVVVGYSRGADVIPAMVNRLPPDLLTRIRLVALLGPSPRVELEFHVADWLHDNTKGLSVKSEIDRMRAMRIVCIWGEDDRGSLCPHLSSPEIHLVTLKGAHHFDGDYEKLARIVLDELK